ncbi:MAG: hypothetical protein DI634_03580 [Kocuria palustris]|nr:MAG: hypothetical protein DI634_03580 [Kocuria palustris]
MRALASRPPNRIRPSRRGRGDLHLRIGKADARGQSDDGAARDICVRITADQRRRLPRRVMQDMLFL